MNYLAHFYLADHTSTSIVGSLMGDFVRGPLEGRYPQEIERGIRLHRRVDTYTDSHPTIVAARRRFEPPFRRYAGIILDVLFDHFLARDWDRLHALSLEKFADSIHRTMEQHRHLFDDDMRLSLDYMRERRLLLSYRELDGIDRALSGLSTRLSRPNPLAEGGAQMRRHYTELEADFRSFFPELVRFSHETAAGL